jgi:hypothetical protein
VERIERARINEAEAEKLQRGSGEVEKRNKYGRPIFMVYFSLYLRNNLRY